MKKLLLAFAMSTLTINAYSAGVVVLDNEAQLLNIPSIYDSKGNEIFTSAKLIIREDGLFELTDLVKYEKPVCSGGGTPAGEEAFIVDSNNPGHYTDFYVGDVFETDSGELIIITGMTTSGVGYYDSSYSFSLAPYALPEPENGKKGAYYYQYSGEIAYADFL